VSNYPSLPAPRTVIVQAPKLASTRPQPPVCTTVGLMVPHALPCSSALEGAIDAAGLRYQTLDVHGVVREQLSWPLPEVLPEAWRVLSNESAPPIRIESQVIVFAFAGTLTHDGVGAPQTWLSAWQSDRRLAQLWIGVCGVEHELTVTLTPTEGRSPQLWRGPHLLSGGRFSLQIAVHPGMGPGGILWRADSTSAWNSLLSTAGWGAERIEGIRHWSVGHDRADPTRSA